MYQSFFQLTDLPFNITPNADFFCNLKGHQEAYNTLLFCLKSGEGFIKIVGEVGSGKTLICRKFLDSLDSSYISAYIPNPELSPIELRKAFAREIGMKFSNTDDQHELLTNIFHHLIYLRKNDKKVVFVIDEAQALSDESLEALRLLTNLETQHEKLLQVVLFGQPELDEKLNKVNLRQLKQRITFSYQLPLLGKEDINVYLNHRLSVAGYTYGNLFTNKALKLLHKASRGIPRLINILSHKALLAAYGKGEKKVTHHIMKLAINDTESVMDSNRVWLEWAVIGLLIFIIIVALIMYLDNLGVL